MRVRRDCFAEFILNATEGLAMTIERPYRCGGGNRILVPGHSLGKRQHTPVTILQESQNEGN